MFQLFAMTDADQVRLMSDFCTQTVGGLCTLTMILALIVLVDAAVGAVLEACRGPVDPADAFENHLSPYQTHGRRHAHR